MEEIWKKIENFEGYEISSLGRVKSLKNKREKILSQHLWGAGYPTVNLWSKNKNHSTTIHSLLAKHFIPNPENKPCINHKNGIKSDSRIENLEWCTFSDNSSHAYNTGLRSSLKGEKQNKSKLKNEDVLEIRKMCSAGIQNIDIAKKYKICATVISRIKNRHYWIHI